MSTAPTNSNSELMEGLVTGLQRHLPGLLAAYLFGSYSRGGAREDSDLDVAVLGERPLSTTDRFEAALTIGAELSKDVDLIDLRTASTVLRSQAVTRGTRIIGDEIPEVEAFEDFVYSDYARLNEERAGILEDIAARGAIRDR